jgi:hypothetical protein
VQPEQDEFGRTIFELFGDTGQKFKKYKKRSPEKVKINLIALLNRKFWGKKKKEKKTCFTHLDKRPSNTLAK